MSKINLAQLRADALDWKHDPNKPPPPYEPVLDIAPDTLLALIDTAEAATRLADEIEWTELGASGPPDYLARTLTSFTTTEPT